jgi:hypothetical protein
MDRGVFDYRLKVFLTAPPDDEYHVTTAWDELWKVCTLS